MSAAGHAAGPTDIADRTAASRAYLDEEAIRAIVAMPDPVARNAEITRGYHALAILASDVIGRENANWLCFGQWASAEAGRAIRGASVPALLRPLMGESVTTAVAAGKAAVFGDIAPPFATNAWATSSRSCGPTSRTQRCSRCRTRRS